MKRLYFEHMNTDEIETFLKDIGATNSYATIESQGRRMEYVEFAVNNKRYRLAGYGLQLQQQDEIGGKED